MGYTVKVYKSGNTIEIVEYGKPVLFTKAEMDKSPPKGRSLEASEGDKLVNRYQTMRRARTLLRRLVQANNGQWYDNKGSPYKSVFMTLTFAENIKDFETANHEFKLFIKRLGNAVFDRLHRNNLQYVVVPEFQKRGAIHYHLIIFNMPYIKASKIEALWRNGFIKLKAIDHVTNVGAYICKYMGKDLEDERLTGKKCYFTSRGLKKPIQCNLDTRNEEDRKKLESVIQTAQAHAKEKPYQVTYDSDYYELIMYTQYNI